MSSPFTIRGTFQKIVSATKYPLYRAITVYCPAVGSYRLLSKNSQNICWVCNLRFIDASTTPPRNSEQSALLSRQSSPPPQKKKKKKKVCGRDPFMLF